MPGTANEARFTIEGTASEDANGDRGYDAAHSQTLDVTLEVSPSPVLAATYSVYDAAISDSPLASKDASVLTWTEGAASSVTPSGVNDTVHLDMPASGVHSWILRCVAITPAGSEIFERIVSIRTEAEASVRKTVPAESGQYTARGTGFSDAMNELTDAVGAVAGGDSVRFRTSDDFYIIGFGEDLSPWAERSVGGGAVTLADGEDTEAKAAGAGLLEMNSGGNGGTSGIKDASTWFNGGHNPVLRVKIKTADVLADEQIRVGVADDPAGITNGAYITSASGTWSVDVISSDGASDDSDTGLGTCVADTWYNLRVEVDADSEARFYVDGILIATLSGAGAVPTVNDKLGQFAEIIKTGEGGSDSTYLDTMTLDLTRL